MAGRFVLGIDFGTESGRVMLVRLDNGEEAACKVVPYPRGVIEGALPDGTPLPESWALQDPRDYHHVLNVGIPAVLRESGVSAGQVEGIGVDFTSCTVLPALGDGTPLCVLPAYSANPHAWVKLWKHHAAQPQADRINEIGRIRKEPVMRVYGGRYSSEWFFSKVLETLEQAPEIYNAADRFIEAADWITWQLTGEERRNECCAGYKGMWIKGQGFPSRGFFRDLNPTLENVVERKLSRDFIPLGAPAGELSKEMAEVLGLRSGIAVAAGVIDAHAAVPGCGVVRPGTMVMIMGTSLCHMLLSDQQHFVEGVAGVVRDGIIPGYWGYEAGQAAVGDLYAWFFRTFGISPEEATEKAAQLRPGQSGLIALDWWNGNRSVLMDAGLSGVLVGATLSTQPAEIYRALIEATAFGTLTVIRAFEREGIEIEKLVACGGLAEKSPLVMQIFADVTGRSIYLPHSLQASGLGAAIHAAVACGAYRSIPQAATAMAGLAPKAYHPDAAAHSVYLKLYAEYTDLHDYFGRGATRVMRRLRALKQAPSAISATLP